MLCVNSKNPGGLLGGGGENGAVLEGVSQRQKGGKWRNSTCKGAEDEMVR